MTMVDMGQALQPDLAGVWLPPFLSAEPLPMGGSHWLCGAFLQEFLWRHGRMYHLAAGNKSRTWFHGSSSLCLEEEEGRGKEQGPG